MAKEIVSAQQLREALDYCAETGVFTRRAPCMGVNVGDVAGGYSRGYILIGVLGRLYKAHRLAWLYVRGDWPVGQIDHIDGCRNNNRIANLRDVTNRVNIQNQRRARSDNTHGFLGVSRNRKRWKAEIVADGKKRHIGTFDTPELAHAAYLEAKRRLHPGCTI